MAAYQPHGPTDLTWREAFWRFCALAFVRFRLRNDPPHPNDSPVLDPVSFD
jgi:hypothetical protein